MSKILKNLVLIFFLYLLITRPAYSVNITGANTINSDSTTVQTYNADDTSLTITNSSTLSRTGQAPVNINEKENGTLTIHSGSSLTATSHNTVQGKDQTGLTVTNSGTISFTSCAITPISLSCVLIRVYSTPLNFVTFSSAFGIVFTFSFSLISEYAVTFAVAIQLPLLSHFQLQPAD